MRFILTASCLGLVLGALWATRPGADVLPYPTAAHPAHPAKPHAGGLPAPVAGNQWLADAPADEEKGRAVIAATSMAEARLHGDERTPPLQPQVALVAAPTPAQLADPAAYRAYEHDAHVRTLNAFAAAAEAELPVLRADVARARAAGIPREEIVKVEAKIEGLERVRREIVEGGVRP